MKELTENLKVTGSTTGYFRRGIWLLKYPGYKKAGDYRLSENGKAPEHEDVVIEIFNFTNEENFNT